MPYIKGYEHELSQPLKEVPEKSKLHSPRPGVQHGTEAPASIESGKLDEVIEVREQVRCKHWPSEYLQHNGSFGLKPPVLLKDMGIYKHDPNTAAQAVAMDKPFDLGVALWDALQAMGVPLKEKHNYVPFIEQFAHFLVMLNAANYEALDRIFDIKYYWMEERPETVLGLPGAVFTGDKYGAPNHPAYGAGHGAVSGATYAIICYFFDLTDDQKALVWDACYQFAHWRTLLGVHYREDNDLGLAQGVEIGNLQVS